MKLELIRIKEKEFPKIENPHFYTEIKIWHCNYKSLEPIKHFVNARKIEIATFPNEKIDFIEGLQLLEYLYILHLPKLNSIQPLRNLKNLTELELSVLPSWDPSGKSSIIDSLEPLSTLDKLKNLSLFGVIPEDGNLICLAKCKSLVDVRIGNQFTIEQLAGLKALKPSIGGIFFEPLAQAPYNFCKKCGSQKVMLSGVLKYCIKCPKCNKKRIDAHLAEWKQVIEKYGNK